MVPHAYRKLAAFWSPLDHFLFLDADVVVCGPIHDLINPLRDVQSGLMAFDADLDQVYCPGVFRDQNSELHLHYRLRHLLWLRQLAYYMALPRSALEDSPEGPG